MTGSTQPPRRFPRFVFDHGSEPDPRFSLANERTYLAWIRTALALTAGGVALELLGGDLNPILRAIAATILIAAGTSIPLLAWHDWAANERALRRERPLRPGTMSVAIAVAIVAAGALTLAASVWP
ncbi:YidH family protein [Microbacterium sulfonylureivorans]|uniref:YidH family protein n=1 Tax=Microbacterium sulfonylureivorans TaxID=2486854 RepID=UPI000FDB003D|nr:DUF202 domain-containing protein [Microbacterium sulfonylureivorans]